MRVFKAQFKNKSGETQKSKKWYIDFVDHAGARHRIPGFENKRRTEDFGRNIEDLVSTKSASQRPDTHGVAEHERSAVEALPDLLKPANTESQKATGTDGIDVTEVDSNYAIYLAKLGTENGNQPEL
ncbi:MAG: hypothetical protein FVQ82_06125 [Planctomycetes bacterium]|nr:hypothetical protein [Planctomycetota bacterium]